MSLGDTQLVYVALALQDRQALDSVFPDVSVADSREVKVSNRVSANLASHDFEIVPQSPSEQAVKTSGVTVWSWLVTPKAAGQKTLTISLSAVVPVGENDAPIVVTTYERTVSVEVGFFQAMAVGAEKNQWMAVWITILASFLIFCWSKRNVILRWIKK